LANGPNLTASTSTDRTSAQMVDAAPSVVTVQMGSDGAAYSGYLRLNLTTPDDFRIFMTNNTQFEMQYENGTVIKTELTVGYEDRYPMFNNSKFMGLESETAGIYYMHFSSASNETKMVIVQGSGEEEVNGVVHKHGLNDPHFWIDPISAKTQVNNIAHAFETADPANATFYQSNADNLNGRLDALNQEYVVGLQNRTKNAIITTHEGFNYMAQRYHFDAYGAVGISGDNQPSAQDIATLADQVRTLGLHYVFSEPIFSDAVINTIASETGTQVLVLDGIHGRSGVHVGMDYFQIMRANLQALEVGLEVTS
ncbi:MAG: zinc ABC transporter substrate-binding protein, partial [Methanomassiliicoccales archaeon]